MTTARRRPANGADGRAAYHAAFFPPSSPLLPTSSARATMALYHATSRSREGVRWCEGWHQKTKWLPRCGGQAQRCAATKPQRRDHSRWVDATCGGDFPSCGRQILTRPAKALLSSLSSLTKVAIDLEVRDEHFVIRDRARGARPEVLRQIGSNRQSNSRTTARRTTAHRTTAHRTESTTMIDPTRDSIQSEWARGAEASTHYALVVVLRPFDDSERVCRDAMPPECSGRDEMRRGARALGHDTGFASRSADAAATGGASSAALRRHCVGTASALRRHCVGTAPALRRHCVGTASALRRHCVGVRTSIESR